MVNALLEREPGIRLSVSYTTRPPRPGESEGVHYHFVDVPTFLALKDGGEFLEHAFVHGNWYATSATWLRAQVARGPGRAARNRLAGRGAGAAADARFGATSSSCRRRSQSLKERLDKAGAGSAGRSSRSGSTAAREEMRHCGEFDYVIMNQDFARAVDDLSAIVRAARLTAAAAAGAACQGTGGRFSTPTT